MVRAAAAKFIGTAILVFTGTAVAVDSVLSRPAPGGVINLLGLAAFGLALVALVAALGYVSGAYLTPAVTIARGHSQVSVACVPAYVDAQFGSAILAPRPSLTGLGWCVPGEASRRASVVAGALR